jgi:hypothetical protein
MSYLGVILLVSLAITGGGLWLYTRLRVVRRVANGVLQLRQLASAPVIRRPVGTDHPALGEHAATYARFDDEVAAVEGTLLGDSEELAASGKSNGVTRWFTDRTGHIVGWFGVGHAAGKPASVVYCITELTPAAYVASSRSPTSRFLCIPPDCSREFLSPGTSLEALLSQHRVRVGRHAGATASLVRNKEEAQATVDRYRDHVRAWRERQDRETLLDQDLRSVLGQHYSRLGPAVARILRKSR